MIVGLVNDRIALEAVNVTPVTGSVIELKGGHMTPVKSTVWNVRAGEDASSVPFDEYVMVALGVVTLARTRTANSRARWVFISRILLGTHAEIVIPIRDFLSTVFCTGK